MMMIITMTILLLNYQQRNFDKKLNVKFFKLITILGRATADCRRLRHHRHRRPYFAGRMYQEERNNSYQTYFTRILPYA